jgi:hypothetical protein
MKEREHLNPSIRAGSNPARLLDQSLQADSDIRVPHALVAHQGPRIAAEIRKNGDELLGDV